MLCPKCRKPLECVEMKNLANGDLISRNHYCVDHGYIHPTHKKNDIVYCCKCNKDLFRFTCDVYKGEIPNADMFTGIRDVESPVNGELMDCPLCGYPYYNHYTGKMTVRGE
jgi:hypothetical protein